jgi:thiol:disulfide interchange protein DsbC
MLRILVGLCIAGLSMAVAAAEDLNKLKTVFEQSLQELGMKVEQIKPSPVAGVYEVIASGQVLYVSTDGRYIFQGLYDRVDRVNLGEKAKSTINAKLMAKVNDTNTIVFAPKNPKYMVTVFTDTSCGYCRKLHSEVPELNKLGVKVRYMMFPRHGIDSPDGKILESVWCAKNKQEAMNIAKSGGQVPEKSCANPIAEHMELAQKFGLQGTPMMITGKGTVISGYLEPAQLVARLEQEAK